MTLAVNIAQGGSNNVTFRNRIINGAQVINQRYGTTAQTGVSGFVTDRFQVLNSSAGTINAQTVTTAPAGFSYSTQLTVGTADSAVGSTDSVIFYQTLEGYNIADLNWAGTNAKIVTLSFWVYSSLIGTYSGSIVDAGGSVSYPFNYTISTANTWTQITQTITGPVSGTFGSTNGVGFYLELSLMTGSSFQGTPNAWAAGNFRGTASQVNWMATSGNTWYITGVQLEAGTTASPFEYRQYGTELALCQRYYEIIGQSNDSLLFQGYVGGVDAIRSPIFYKVTKRATPTLTINGTWVASNKSAAAAFIPRAGLDAGQIEWVTSGAGVSYFYNNNVGSNLTVSAEL
jgi:hypothetical protein